MFLSFRWGQFHQSLCAKQKVVGAQHSAKIRHSISPTFGANKIWPISMVKFAKFIHSSVNGIRQKKCFSPCSRKKSSMLLKSTGLPSISSTFYAQIFRKKVCSKPNSKQRKAAQKLTWVLVIFPHVVNLLEFHNCKMNQNVSFSLNNKYFIDVSTEKPEPYNN
jgi:hypothetical protein